MPKATAAYWLLAGATAASPPPDFLDLSLDELMQVQVGLTGSRLQRDPSRSAAPLLVYTRADIERSGAQTLGDFLHTLPVNGSVLNNNGSSGTAHGTASVNLRNLGENRSLVLLNGRRLANGTATRGFRDFVDLNTVPLALIERIEILGAGASAIYGADAIAGVINLISRGEYRGQSLSASIGETSRGDGGQQRAEWLGGRQDDTWSLWGGLSWQQYQPIVVDDRGYSAVPLGALSNVTPQGRFSVPGLGTLTLRDGAAGTHPEDFRAFDPVGDGSNNFADTYLRYPSEQSALFTEARWQTESVRWFAEAWLVHRESEQNFSPAQTGVSGALGFSMPASHPFNPFGIDLTGNGFSAARGLRPLGQRVNRQVVESRRLLLGAQGEWWKQWQWELTTSAAQNRGEFLLRNQLNRDHLALSIGPVERCAEVPECVAVPLFAADSAYTDEMLDWLRVNGRDRNDVEQYSVQASTRGELLQLPAGPLQLAAGVEYRRERGSDRPDALISGDSQYTSGPPTSGQQRDGTVGAYRVAEAFVEANASLWQRGDAQLQGNAALRHSDYDSFGGETTGQIGLWFAPNEHWSWRATAAQAFRAPSILELFEGGRITNLPGIDPCSGGATLPGCAGVPAEYQQSGSQVVARVSGNPQLSAETARQYNIGVRWKFARQWALAVDAYRIHIDDLVLAFSSQQILNDCAFAGRRCELIQRDPSSGRIRLMEVRRDNAGQREVAGLDIALDGQWQAWTLRAQAGYLHRFEDRQQIGNDTESLSMVGQQLLRSSFPRWRALLALDWQHDDWQASWRWRYLHSMHEASEQPDIAAVNYHDLQINYRLSDALVSYAGVGNLFDQDPPTSLGNANINFDIASYDTRGRWFYLGAKWDW